MKKLIILFVLLCNSTFWAQTSFSFIGVSNGYFSDTNVIIDVDNDGDDDIIYYFQNQLILKENIGNLNFSNQVIDSNISNVKDIKIIDIDNDGDKDIIVALYTEHKIAFYENAGFNTFTSQNVIATSIQGVTSIAISDINNDGFYDIISTAIIENRIYLHTNNGDKTFQTSVIASNDAGVKKVVVADIDLDNDIDIISMSNNYINFYENVNNVFMYNNIYTMPNGNVTYLLMLTDIDNDGDNDIVFNESNNSGFHGIIKIINLGNGYFDQPVSVAVDGYMSDCFDIKDYDNNGIVDVAYAKAFNHNQPYNYDIVVQNVHTFNGGSNITYISSFDFDNDGDIDLIANNHWYENYTLEILTQPMDLTITIGGNGIFSFIAKDALSYKWQIKNGSNYVDITDNTHFSGSDTNELTVLSPNIGQYIFRCKISNDSGNQFTNDAVLNVTNTNAINDITTNMKIFPNPTKSYININVNELLIKN